MRRLFVSLKRFILNSLYTPLSPASALTRHGQPDIRPRNTLVALFVAVLLLKCTLPGTQLLRFSSPFLFFGMLVMGGGLLYWLRDLEYGTVLTPFGAALLICLAVQHLSGQPYYNGSRAQAMTLQLLASLMCCILISQLGFSRVFWQVINAAALFCACCALAQGLLKPLGIRLDQMGWISDWFFEVRGLPRQFRPSGPVSEPAILAQLLLPSLYYHLFVQTSPRKALLLCAALVLSTSALGLVGMTTLLLLWLATLDTFYPISSRKKWRIFVLALAAGLLCLAVCACAGVFVVERVISGSTIKTRLLRSVDLYGLLSPLEKLVGVGLQNQQRYLDYFQITLPNDTKFTGLGGSREYACMLGYLACTTGLLGLVSFLFPFYRALRRDGLRTRVMVGLMLYVMLFCSMLGHSLMVLYILCVFAVQDMERNGQFPVSVNYQR